RRWPDPGRSRDRGGAGDPCTDHVPRGACGKPRGEAALPAARGSRPRGPARLLRAWPGCDRHGAQAEPPMSPGGVDARVTVGAVTLPTPGIAASGTFGYGLEFAGIVDLAAIGAICVKGLSLGPCAGKPPPRLVECPAGMLNAIGLQNIGVEEFLRDRLPALVPTGAPVVADFLGHSPDQFAP